MDREPITGWDDDKLVSVPIVGPDDGHTQLGEMRFLGSLALGRPRYIDGYKIRWMGAFAQINARNAAQVLGRPLPSGQPDVTPPFLLPAIIIDLPDYPSPDTVSYVLGIEDAKLLHETLGDQIKEGERELGRLLRIAHGRADRTDAEAAAKRATKEAIRCSFPGCKRSRQFFTDGKGYCKRHTPNRPTGKV